MAARHHPLDHSAEQLAGNSSLNVAAKRKFLASGNKTNRKRWPKLSLLSVPRLM
jgi:hypothetical protein